MSHESFDKKELNELAIKLGIDNSTKFSKKELLEIIPKPRKAKYVDDVFVYNNNVVCFVDIGYKDRRYWNLQEFDSIWYWNDAILIKKGVKCYLLYYGVYTFECKEEILEYIYPQETPCFITENKVYELLNFYCIPKTEMDNYFKDVHSYKGPLTDILHENLLKCY
jgi:hypothetical protein